MTDIKQSILDQAGSIVSGARRAAYGAPEDNFERIARFWQAYFDSTGRGEASITAADVSPLMRLTNEARLCESPDHRDSFVDIVGYALTGAEINVSNTGPEVQTEPEGLSEDGLQTIVDELFSENMTGEVAKTLNAMTEAFDAGSLNRVDCADELMVGQLITSETFRRDLETTDGGLLRLRVVDYTPSKLVLEAENSVNEHRWTLAYEVFDKLLTGHTFIYIKEPEEEEVATEAASPDEIAAAREVLKGMSDERIVVAIQLALDELDDRDD